MEDNILKAYITLAEAAHGKDDLYFFKQVIRKLSKTNLLTEKEALLNKEPTEFLLGLGLGKVPLGKRDLLCEKILAGDSDSIKAIFEGH